MTSFFRITTFIPPRHTHNVLKASVCLLIAGSLAGSLRAQTIPPAHDATTESVGTIVYDARLREFPCWSEGALTTDARSHLCDQSRGWHPVTANLFFVRGQAISILVMNGVAEDIFSLDLKADDLAEPTVPISGALTELPKLQSLTPAPSVIAGIGTSFAAALTPIRATTAYRQALTAEDKDFKAWVQTTLIDPLNAKEVTDFLAIDLDTPLAQAADASAYLTALKDIQNDLATASEPTDMNTWLKSAQALARIIDRETALRSQLTTAGMTTAGKAINDAALALRSAPLQRAIAVDPGDFLSFASVIATAFRDQPYARINAITVANKAFESPEIEMKTLIKNLNAALGAIDPATALARVKINLTTLADNQAQLQIAEQHRESIKTVQTSLDAQKGDSAGIYALQIAWTAVATRTISKAAIINAKGRTLPLEAPYDILPLGQWFGNKTITVTVKQGQRTALFDIGGVADSTRTSIITADVPSAKATQTAAADLSAARSLQFPIYTRYHFKAGLGFLYSTADDNRYQVDKVTTGSGTSAVTEEFIDQTRARDYNLLATANLIIFPWAQHAFPFRPRYDGDTSPPWYHDVGLMVGFSVTTPNRDFLLGASWFPRTSPVGLQVAWHVALRDYPPPNVDITKPLTDRVVLLRQRRLNGFGIGLVFTTDFFGKVFAPIFKP